MCGLAGRRRGVSIEICARSRMSACIPDAGGAVPQRRTITPGAPAIARGRAPFAQLLAAARAPRVTTASARVAAPLLCNYVYGPALEAAAKPDGPRLAVFIHVPRVGQKFRPRKRAKQREFTLDELVRVGGAIVAAGRMGRDHAH